MEDCSLHSFWLPMTAEMLHQSLRHQEYVTLRGIPFQHAVHANTLPKQTARAYSATVAGCVGCAVCCNATGHCSLVSNRSIWCRLDMRIQSVYACMTSGGKDGNLEARMWGSRRSSRMPCCLRAR